MIRDNVNTVDIFCCHGQSGEKTPDEKTKRCTVKKYFEEEYNPDLDFDSSATRRYEEEDGKMVRCRNQMMLNLKLKKSY